MTRETKDAILAAAKKVKLDKLIKSANEMFKMKVYEKIELKTYDPTKKIFATYLFGRKKEGNCEVTVQEQSVFYLKINREADYTMICIQHWINIVHAIGGKLYFICDNQHLERRIMRECRLWDEDITFLPSIRKRLDGIAKTLNTGLWKMVTYAHLTAFYHAKEHGITRHWDIDADDTLIFLDAPRVAEALKQVETVAEKNDIKACSLDMHWSRSAGRHWSLGVLYIRDNDEFCRHFEANKDLSWDEKYLKYTDDVNIDWYFTYLKEQRNINIQTFYIENCYFFHWGCDFMRIPFGGPCYWQSGKIIFPIMRDMVGSKTLGEREITDCLKIDIGASLSESKKFWEEELFAWIAPNKTYKKFLAIESFEPDAKYDFPRS